MKNPVIILLIVILLAVIGIGVFLFITRKKNDAESTPEYKISDNTPEEVIL